MNTVSKLTRELYRDIRSEVIGIHYRLVILRKFFASQDTVNVLNKTAPRFFATLKYDLIDTLVLSIQRLKDPPKSSKKYQNASLEQLINSLDQVIYSQLICELQVILGQIKKDSPRISNWRNKWVGHRDYNVVIGEAEKPAISLPEIENVLYGLQKFLNTFETACQDIDVEWHINDGESFDQFAERFSEGERLKINPPDDYVNAIFLDGSTNLLRLIEQNQDNSINISGG
jgi:hypothetical protein